MALSPIKPLYSASATATNGSDTITVTGGVDCSWLKSGSIIALGTRQLVDAISGTAPDGSGSSTITLRRNWTDPTTTASLLAFMSWEGLADAVVKLRNLAEANESALQGAFSFMGNWSAAAGNLPPTPAEGTGSQMYRISAAGTMAGRAYRVGEHIFYDQFASQWRSTLELATAFSTSLLASADAAAWRSLLSLVKTATPTDTTPGSLMKVGDFGLGSTYTGSTVLPPVPNNNLDGAEAAGIYRYIDVAVGRPNFGSGFGNVLNIPTISVSGQNYGTQFAMDYAQDRVGFRRLTVAWEPWREIYHNANILGTVSESGGLPTGAIIQRGSNANGEFILFADGTQICLYNAPTTKTTSISANSAFVSTPSAFTFPTGFLAVPTVIPAPAVASGALFQLNYSIAIGGFSAELSSASAIAQGRMGYVAIGRWY